MQRHSLDFETKKFHKDNFFFFVSGNAHSETKSAGDTSMIRQNKKMPQVVKNVTFPKKKRVFDRQQ